MLPGAQCSQFLKALVALKKLGIGDERVLGQETAGGMSAPSTWTASLTWLARSRTWACSSCALLASKLHWPAARALRACWALGAMSSSIRSSRSCPSVISTKAESSHARSRRGAGTAIASSTCLAVTSSLGVLITVQMGRVLPPKVNRSPMAAQSRGSAEVLVQQE